MASGSQATAANIVSVARRCFETNGVRKTTMEDIASAAGLSRQTVYKYFSNKQEIVDQVGLAEMMAIQTSLRGRIDPAAPLEERLVEAVLLSVRVAMENEFIRAVTEDLHLVPGMRSSDNPVYTWLRTQWEPLLKAGRSSGRLASDLSSEEIVSWLALSQFMLCVKLEHQPMTDDEIRHLIRRFVVAALAAPPAPRPAETTLAPSALREENEQLRELVTDQALELRSLRARLNR